jgi:hypothetical protein
VPEIDVTLAPKDGFTPCAAEREFLETINTVFTSWFVVLGIASTASAWDYQRKPRFYPDQRDVFTIVK